MGVDLTLMPLIGEDFWAAHDMLRLERRRELWEPIQALPQQPIPQPLGCYVARDKTGGDTCYGYETSTPYGERITWTTAADLLTLKNHMGAQDNWQNRAVWSYLEHMPPNWKICLWWS